MPCAVGFSLVSLIWVEDVAVVNNDEAAVDAEAAHHLSSEVMVTAQSCVGNASGNTAGFAAAS